MPQRIVNADAYTYAVDNPVPGQPPIARTAHFGERVELSDAEVARGEAITVARDYPVGKTTVRRMEPALLPADATLDPAVSGREAARLARVEALRQELEALEGAPPAVPLLDSGLAPIDEDDEGVPAPTKAAPPAPPAPPATKRR